MIYLSILFFLQYEKKNEKFIPNLINKKYFQLFIMFYYVSTFSKIYHF